MKYMMIDLYTHVSEIVDAAYAEALVIDCELIEGDRSVWKCEEYIVIQLLAGE